MVVQGDIVTLTLAGTAESNAVDAAQLAFAELDTKAVAAKVPRVVVDLLGLEFATSSVLKVFVVWLMKVAGDRRYKVTFRSAAKHQWQRRSLAALVSLATPDVVTVDAT